MNAPPVLSAGIANFVPTERVVEPASGKSAPIRRIALVDFTTGNNVVPPIVPQETLAKH